MYAASVFYFWKEGEKMKKPEIKKISGREIIDSRGNPTVEAVVFLADGTSARGTAPSGASTGEFEAHELRDGNIGRYCGKGVTKAVGNINDIICPLLERRDASDIYGIDECMIREDGTREKSNLGANALLAVSSACAKAASKFYGIPLYRFLGGVQANVMPVPMMNILNGGAHASNNVDVQEFMIMPVGAGCFSEALRQCTEVYHSLASILKSKGQSTAVGDEGGFAPDMESDEEAVVTIIEAVKAAGYDPGNDFMIALDAAASEWKSPEKGKYILPKSGKVFTSEDLVQHWKNICDRYPVISIEDALDEEDWDGWKMLTRELGNRVQLVGDDLFVTNTARIAKGAERGCGNSVLIKLNQIGTVSETIEAVKTAHKSGYTAIASHRSGETADTFISDLSVGLCTGQIKSGAPCRAERTSKYNQLLRIEECLGKSALYPGLNAFGIKKIRQ